MLSDKFAFLVGVPFKACYHVPASLTDIAGMATWTNNFTHNTTLMKGKSSVFVTLELVVLEHLNVSIV